MENFDFLSSLNEPQRQSVLATEGTVRVQAYAGTGKTNALTHRYAYIAGYMGIDPDSILCITFTNKAANEMKGRIKKMVEIDGTMPYICTIHSLCVKILRKEIYRIGYPSNFTILDTTDASDIASIILNDLEIDREEKKASDVLKEVSDYKKSHNFVQDIMKDGRVEETARNPMLRYMSYQRAHHSLDFDDLLYTTEFLLSKYEDVRKEWGEKFQYIMVDEAQDCSKVDWKIIDALSEANGNLFFVGDYFQEIYRFRGTKGELFTEHKAEKDIVFSTNYRSVQAVLDLANDALTHISSGIKANLVGVRGQGDKPIHYCADSQDLEAEFVIGTIDKMIKDGASPNDFAVIYRASFLSRQLEQKLVQKAIPYRIWGGMRFYDRAEVKNALAYIKLIGKDDDLSFERIVNVPSRKFGKKSLQRLKELAKQEGLTLFDCLAEHKDEKPFDRANMKTFVDIIQKARDEAHARPFYDVITDVLIGCGLMAMYRKDSDTERIDNINELVDSIKRYYEDRKNETDIFSSYLQDITLLTSMDKKDMSSEMVTLSTVHSVKGLEFKNVFVYGMTEGVFPHKMALAEGDEKSERNLFYVAITRAMDKLWITNDEGSNWYNQDKNPSRFINEMDTNLYEEATPRPEKSIEGKFNFNFGKFKQTGAFVKGDIVRSMVFGTGKVIMTNGKSSVVQFKNKTRTIQNSYLKKC